MRLFVRDEVLRTIPLPYAPFHALSIVVRNIPSPSKVDEGNEATCAPAWLLTLLFHLAELYLTHL